MKTRSDSLAAKLSPDQREELLQMLCEANAPLQQALEKCQAWKVRTSIPSISRFGALHGFNWRLERARAAAQAVEGLAPGDAERKRVIGQKVFEIVARGDANDKAVLMAKSLELEERALEGKERKTAAELALRGQALKLAERKVALLESKIQKVAAATKKLRDPKAAIGEAERTAILDAVDAALGIKKKS